MCDWNQDRIKEHYEKLSAKRELFLELVDSDLSRSESHQPETADLEIAYLLDSFELNGNLFRSVDVLDLDGIIRMMKCQLVELQKLIHAMNNFDPVAIYLGDGRVKLPNREHPVIVNKGLIPTLEFLIEHGTATVPELAKIKSNPAQEIIRLRSLENGALAEFVLKPERKGAGYRCLIKKQLPAPDC